MPIKQLHGNNHEQWALWYIDENEEYLAQQVNERVPIEIISSRKRLEWLAARALIKVLAERAGLVFMGTAKDEFGKPGLTGHPKVFISLSHSFPYVAAQISATQSVGIDVEQPRPKLLTIAPRILAENELTNAGHDVVKHCLYWCAKEALYKIYGKGGLHFRHQLNLEPFTRELSGTLSGIISGNSEKQKVTLGYEVHPDFVVVFTQTGIDTKKVSL